MYSYDPNIPFLCHLDSLVSRRYDWFLDVMTSRSSSLKTRAKLEPPRTLYRASRSLHHTP